MLCLVSFSLLYQLDNFDGNPFLIVLQDHNAPEMGEANDIQLGPLSQIEILAVRRSLTSPTKIIAIT